MTKTRSKTGFLLPDFGVEDVAMGIRGGRAYKGSSYSMANSLANKVGCFAAFNDLHNTDATNFAMEAVRLNGEAQLLSAFAAQGLEEINHDYKMIVAIKQKYGVEGLDPYKFGREGVKEILQKVGMAIVTTFKKIIQAISNFIRSVLNMIGGAMAKGQSKLFETYGNKYSDLITKFDAKAKKVKAAIVTNNGKKMNDAKDGNVANLRKVPGLLEKYFRALHEEGGRLAGGDLWNLKNHLKELGDAFKDIAPKTDPGATADTAKWLSSVSPSKIVNLAIYGKEKPEINEQTPGAIINNNGFSILSAQRLNAEKSAVQISQLNIKAMNFGLSEATKISKIRTAEKSADAAATKNAELKDTAKTEAKQRQLLSFYNYGANAGGKLNGVMLHLFAAFLRQRSYTAAAIKSLVAASKKEGAETTT